MIIFLKEFKCQSLNWCKLIFRAFLISQDIKIQIILQIMDDLYISFFKEQKKIKIIIMSAWNYWIILSIKWNIKIRMIDLSILVSQLHKHKFGNLIVNHRDHSIMNVGNNPKILRIIRIRKTITLFKMEIFREISQIFKIIDQNVYMNWMKQ